MKNLKKFLYIPDLFLNLPLCPYKRILNNYFLIDSVKKSKKTFLGFPFFCYFMTKKLMFEKKNSSKNPCVFLTPPFFIRNLTTSFFSDLFRLKLKISGVGYFFRQIASNILELLIGFSHPIYYHFPENVFFRLMGRKKRFLIIWSADHDLLTKIAYKFRKLKKLDIYRNKGIRFFAETLPLKTGKKKFV